MTKLAVTERSLFEKHWHALKPGNRPGKWDEFRELVRFTYGNFSVTSPLVNGLPVHCLYVFEFPTAADAVAFRLRHSDELEFIDAS